MASPPESGPLECPELSALLHQALRTAAVQEELSALLCCWFPKGVVNALSLATSSATSDGIELQWTSNMLQTGSLSVKRRLHGSALTAAELVLTTEGLQAQRLRDVEDLRRRYGCSCVLGLPVPANSSTQQQLIAGLSAPAAVLMGVGTPSLEDRVVSNLVELAAVLSSSLPQKVVLPPIAEQAGMQVSPPASPIAASCMRASSEGPVSERSASSEAELLISEWEDCLVEVGGGDLQAAQAPMIFFSGMSAPQGTITVVGYLQQGAAQEWQVVLGDSMRNVRLQLSAPYSFHPFTSKRSLEVSCSQAAGAARELGAGPDLWLRGGNAAPARSQAQHVTVVDDGSLARPSSRSEAATAGLQQLGQPDAAEPPWLTQRGAQTTLSDWPQPAAAAPGCKRSESRSVARPSSPPEQQPLAAAARPSTAIHHRTEQLQRRSSGSLASSAAATHDAGMHLNQMTLCFLSPDTEARYLQWLAPQQAKIDGWSSTVASTIVLVMGLLPPFHFAWQFPSTWLCILCLNLWLPALWWLKGKAWYLRYREPLMQIKLLALTAHTTFVTTAQFSTLLAPHQLSTALWQARMTLGEGLMMFALMHMVRFRRFLPMQIINWIIVEVSTVRMCQYIVGVAGGTILSCRLRAALLHLFVGTATPAAIMYVLELKSRRLFIRRMHRHDDPPGKAKII